MSLPPWPAQTFTKLVGAGSGSVAPHMGQPEAARVSQLVHADDARTAEDMHKRLLVQSGP
eukprot:7780962-Pyramimonas_sp.AAC.1